MTSLQCVEAFPPLLCALRENKTVRDMGPKADNIYIVGAGSAIPRPNCVDIIRFGAHDVVHFDSTSTNPSLIPTNHEARQSRRLTHIRNLACNMPVQQSYARSQWWDYSFVSLNNLHCLEYYYFEEIYSFWHVSCMSMLTKTLT